MRYDREVLIDVMIYHWRKNIGSCACGWSELGKSFHGHVADVYEKAISDAAPAQRVPVPPYARTHP